MPLMKTKVIVAIATFVATIPLAAWTVAGQRLRVQAADVTPAPTSHVPTNPSELDVAAARVRADFAAMQTSGLATRSGSTSSPA